ncbi:hypothetical protein GCM10022252_28600 [Streptosporangium oxazolinicum]|uniref:Uncharacterized protein n=1 Tax=Streptosporangium oxazolinicum TaxID=909287 RepID=A0ABP8ATS2_9ACTN
MLIDHDPSLQWLIDSYGYASLYRESRPIAVGPRGNRFTGKDHYGGLELTGFEMIAPRWAAGVRGGDHFEGK